MPKFELNTHPTNQAYDNSGSLVQGYIEAMFFTNGDMGGERENLLNELGVSRLTRDA
jgi:hypothetical protein